MKPVFISVLLIAMNLSVHSQFVIDDIPIGSPDIHYLDPEFIDYNGQCKVMFTEGVYTSGPMWVGDIDPTTGFFLTETGQDYLIDTDLVPLYESIINGPEWGLDQQGLALFYTKYDSDSIKQVWRADLNDPPVLTQLTFDSLDNVHWAGTLNTIDPEITFFLIRLYSEWGPILFYNNEYEVSYDHPVLGYVWPDNNGTRFIPGTNYFVYSKEISPGRVELVRVNIQDHSSQIITNDSIMKVDTWGFKAPEFNNEFCYSALTSDTTIGIYRYINSGDPYATRFATIRVPEGHPLKYISSVEIIQTSTDLFDTTYFAFRGAKMYAPLIPVNSAMWIASLGADPDQRCIRRVDDGAITGDTAYRVEPEWLVGQDEAFLYYNVYLFGGWIKELRRCRTGIFLNHVYVEEKPVISLKVFPNPVSGYIEIANLPEGFDGETTVFDLAGRAVFNEHIFDNRCFIPVNTIPGGIYFLQVKNNKFTFSHKFLRR